jgi:DNA invertase Pin-like site-specific DNA recombinase
MVFGHPGKRTGGALRASIYARVSTHDQQTLPMQNRAMREYAVPTRMAAIATLPTIYGCVVCSE